MLRMLAVRVFLLALEEYFHQCGKVGEGNKVSCDKKGALTTFDKKSKRIPTASRNADVRRAFRELKRSSSLRYKLEYVRDTRTGTKDIVTTH